MNIAGALFERCFFLHLIRTPKRLLYYACRYYCLITISIRLYVSPEIRTVISHYNNIRRLRRGSSRSRHFPNTIARRLSNVYGYHMARIGVSSRIYSRLIGAGSIRRAVHADIVHVCSAHTVRLQSDIEENKINKLFRVEIAPELHLDVPSYGHRHLYNTTREFCIYLYNIPRYNNSHQLPTYFKFDRFHNVHLRRRRESSADGFYVHIIIRRVPRFIYPIIYTTVSPVYAAAVAQLSRVLTCDAEQK